MSLKNVFLGISLMVATAIAASGCDRGVNVIDFAGQDLSSPSEAVTPAEPSGTDSNDTIVPENTDTTTADNGTTTGSGTTTGTGTGSGAQNDPYCPAGMVSQGTPTLCCKIDDPQSCIIVDPVPPSGGGVKPGHLDHIPVDVVVVEPTPPTPPDHGGAGGGSVLDDGDGVGCHFQGPTGGRTRRNVSVGQNDEASEISGKNNCIML